MKPVVLICILFLACGASPLPAGSVLTLADSPQATGKLTLTADTVQVDTGEGSSPAEIHLPDILEANFGTDPFALNFFNSTSDGGHLPLPTWTTQDIGEAAVPGSMTETAGTLTLTGSGVFPAPDGNLRLPNKALAKQNAARVTDEIFFAGQPWTGDGEWTTRVNAVRGGQTIGGLMLRDSLDLGAATFRLAANGQGNGGFAFRPQTRNPLREMQTPIPMDLPIWLRMTRWGASVSASISTDGKAWDLIGQNDLKIAANPWIGLFVDSRHDRLPGSAVFDQVSFTPAPSEAQVLPPGVLLPSGSFLAGAFNALNLDPAQPDASGNFNRSGKSIAIPRAKIAVILMIPTARSQISDAKSLVGLLMKNGDVLNQMPDAISANGVSVSSVLLGMTTYSLTDVRGCFFQPVQPSSAPYEIRLHDGSIIYATGFQAGHDSILIEEASGLALTVSPDEIAQLRAGPAVAQSLAELDWKAVSSPAPTPSPQAPAPNSPPPPANPAPDEPAPPLSWKGPDQEEMIEAPAGTSVNFPLNGRFNTICARIALSPDSPPNVQATVRVLSDGREIGRTPPLGTGDQPRLMKATIHDPKTVTFVVDSAAAGPKVLFIDPVAIRDR